MVSLNVFWLRKNALQLFLSELLDGALDSLFSIELFLDQLHFMLFLLLLDPRHIIFVLSLEALRTLLQVLIVNLFHFEGNCRLLESFFRVLKGIVHRHLHSQHRLNAIDVLYDFGLERVLFHLRLHLLADRF